MRQSMIMVKLSKFLSLRRRDGRALRGIFILLVLLVGTSGCASHRPAQLQLEPPSHVSPLRDAEGTPHLRLLSYNIWGLPGWMTGARPGRYPQIARELERLNPDIILLQEA